MLKLLLKPIVVLFALFILTGCNLNLSTNIEDGKKLNINNPEIIFETTGRQVKTLLDLDKRILTVNTIDRTSDTKAEMKYQRPLKVIYQPIDPRLLPEGDVTIMLAIPYKSTYWERQYFGVESLTKELHLFIDTLPPRITAISLENNSTIHNELTPLLFTLEDNGSKIDPESLSVSINGRGMQVLSVYSLEMI